MPRERVSMSHPFLTKSASDKTNVATWSPFLALSLARDTTCLALCLVEPALTASPGACTGCKASLLEDGSPVR
eukprot:10227605-Lingulodinium_polyedra.AAC.1